MSGSATAVLVGLAFAAGLAGGRWLWLKGVPAVQSYLHVRWVNAVRAAVRMLPPAERERLVTGANEAENQQVLWEEGDA